jgi:5-methyltetrahydrofolate--homocysteine methyltransferase
MILIGERINMTRKSIREKVHARDAEFIAEEARRQTAAGATHIDVNAGADPGREVDDMRWLVEVVAGATELPLSFDSANAAAIKAGLEMCNREGTIINSTTAEAARLAETLPLVSAYNTKIIALTMDDDGMPEDYERRCRIIDKLAATFCQEAIGLDRVLFDTLVRPVSTNQDQVPYMLDAIRYVTEQYPEAHTVAGLTNVSFGVPKRININRAFLVLLLQAGLDAVIIDPTADGMMGALHATLALTGRDEFCMEYITAARAEVF